VRCNERYFEEDAGPKRSPLNKCTIQWAFGRCSIFHGAHPRVQTARTTLYCRAKLHDLPFASSKLCLSSFGFESTTNSIKQVHHRRPVAGFRPGDLNGVQTDTIASTCSLKRRGVPRPVSVSYLSSCSHQTMQKGALAASFGSLAPVRRRHNSHSYSEAAVSMDLHFITTLD